MNIKKNFKSDSYKRVHLGQLAVSSVSKRDSFVKTNRSAEFESHATNLRVKVSMSI